MALESCKSQIAVLEMNGHSVPQRWSSMREGWNAARRQCNAWNVELSAIRRAKVLASRESGYRVAHSRQVVRCHPMETLEHLDADSETDAISDIQPVQNVTLNVRQTCHTCECSTPDALQCCKVISFSSVTWYKPKPICNAVLWYSVRKKIQNYNKKSKNSVIFFR